MDSPDELDPGCGRAGQGPRAGCDVRVTLAVAVAAILAVVASTRPWLPLGVSACCLAGLAVVRTAPRAMAARLAGPLALALLLGLLRGFMSGTTPAAACDLGPWRLTVTREGLLAGGLMMARVLGSMSVLVVLWRALPPEGLFAALHWARMPRTWIEIGMLMYRYTFTMFEQAASVMAAQRIRLGYVGLRRSLGSLGSLAGLVTLRSIDQAERTHEALLARGFQGSLPLPSLPPLGRQARWIILASLAILGSTFWLVERFS
ncbi:MAG: cobalt ECF transporter T component CbiQ [Thermoguttaceae bacterium]|jgi:cobalt/nickel transport system permease protein